MMQPALLAVVLLPLALLSSADAQQPTNPLLWVPGTADCKIQIEVASSYQSPSGQCPGGVNVTAVFGPNPPYDDATMYCVTEYLALTHDPATAPVLANAPGVRTSLQGGVAGTADYLAAWYAALATRNFSTQPGSTNFDVACWDWRLTPDTVASGAEADPWTVRATQAIEILYTASGDRAVYLVGASNGGLWLKALLDSKPQAWRDRYVAGFVGFAPAIGGLNQCFIATVLGLQLNSFNIAPPLAPFVSTFPIGYYCSPQPGLWQQQQPIATDTAPPGAPVQYFAADLERLYTAANMSYTAALLRDFRAPEATWKEPPGVDALIVNGFGVPTFGDVVSDTWAQGLPLRSFNASNPLASFAAINYGDGSIDTIAAAAPMVAGWAAADPCHSLAFVNVTDPAAAGSYPNSTLLLAQGGSPAFHDNLWTNTPSSPSVAPVLDFVTRGQTAPRPGC